ncbi:DUF4159 domain-containing protein [Phycisphaerales bacterium AB-hyl4]|uniref:DUF4159 domain-containing protein n=1 Tax=Natronomicrosphaera hydrolytica TaxID=3242702 RepID=A0ABV4U8N5_9BACT
MGDDRQRRGRPWGACVRGAVSLTLMLIVWAGVTASAVADDRAARAARLETAIEQLKAEAEQLDQLEAPSTRPVFRRPHPALRGWGAEAGPVVLERLQGSFTGNEHRDAYIRWHLMPPVRDMLREAYDTFNNTGEHQLPDGVIRNLRNLTQRLPSPLQIPRLEEYRWEPEDLGQEYRRLWSESRITVGIPPFGDHYYGRAALERASDDQRRTLEPIVARMEELRARLERVRDRQAEVYNERVRQVNSIVRDFRGDVIYALIQSGDADLMGMVIDEISRQVGNQQYIGIDLMEYMYYAMLDGYLALYGAEDLRRASRNLERMARQYDSFRIYRFGEEDPPWYMARPRRNAADMAFHLIHVFQDPAVLSLFQYEATARPREQPFRPSNFVFTADNFTERDVHVAIGRVLEALQNPRRPELQPPYMLDEEERLRRRVQRHDNRHDVIHEVGNHAVAAWAMLAAGESYQQPSLLKRINWVLSGEPPFTYDRGMRLQMLSHMPGRVFQPWVHRDRVMLERGLSEETGNWGRHSGLREPDGWGDHASGAYGMLGLSGAHRAGADIENNTWRLVDAHWRRTQQQTANDQPAGWALGMFNVELSNAERRRIERIPNHNRVTGPMTAAGVFALSLTEHQLSNTRHAPTSNGAMSTELRKGIAWLDANFRLDDPNAEDWYYYMWTIQRVGQITGHRRFGGVDWFRDVTAEMLNRQGRDGLWRDPSGQLGPLMPSSFALLYLSTINTPVAVGKLKFDGPWNNRPHDIWNFSEYATDWYEHDTTWQIVEPTAPISHMVESPILYLSSNARFSFSDAEVQNLREYIDAGGMLLINQEGGGGQAFNQSLRELRERLLPGREFEPLDAGHPLMTINKHLTGRTSVQAIANDIRPLVLYFNRDLGDGLQKNERDRSDSFALLSNTYLYTVGLNARRSRLDRTYIQPHPDARPTRQLAAARIRHGGQYDPEPGALSQLQTLLANEHDVDFRYETVSPTELSGQQLALLTTTGEIDMSDEEVDALRDWVDAGGTLWIDAASGSREASDGVQALVRRLAPGRTGTRLASRDRIISGQDLNSGHDNRRVTYRPYLLIQTGGSTTPRLHQIRIDDRPAIVFSTEDLTAGLAGLNHWGIYGYSVESARNLMVNGVLDVLQRE